MNKKSDLAPFMSVLQSNLEVVESKLIAKLKKQSLLLGDWDPLLLDAHKEEYPSDAVGSLSSYVNFRYYQAMHRRKTASAAHIRKRYEEASRDVTGDGSVDYLLITWAMQNELQLINNLFSKDIVLPNDFVTELYVWIQAAIIATKQLYSRMNEEDQPKTKVLDSEQARKIQASSKVELNSINSRIEETIQELRLSIGSMAKVFYDKLIQVSSSGDINRFKRDQVLRNKLFNEKVSLLLDVTLDARIMRQRIKSLTESGKPLPSSGPRVMVRDVKIPTEELSFWSKLEEDHEKFKFVGQHQDLSDLDIGDPHSQYLLAEGGVVTGDIDVLDGLRIDGVDLSEHRHTGQDGSKQIHGNDLVDASLKDELVSDEKPPRPTDMSIKRFFKESNPPITTVGADVEWVSDDAFTHEVETRRVTKDDEGIGDALGNDLTGIYMVLYVVDQDILLRLDPSTGVVSQHEFWSYSEPYISFSDYMESPFLAFTEHEGKSLLVVADSEWYTKTEEVPPTSSDDWEPRDVTARLHGSGIRPNVQAYQGNIFSLTNGQLAISRDGGETWTTKGGFGRISKSSDGTILEVGDPSEIMQEVPSGYSYETYDGFLMTPGGTMTIYADTSDADLQNGSFFWSDDLGETWEYYPGQEDLVLTGSSSYSIVDPDFHETLRSDDGVIVQIGGNSERVSFATDGQFPYNQIFWARFSTDDAQTWTWMHDHYGNTDATEGHLFQGKNNKIMQMRLWGEYVSFYELNVGTATWQYVSHLRTDGGVLTRPMLSRDGLLVFASSLYTDIYNGDEDMYVNYSYDSGKTWKSVLAYETPTGYTPSVGKTTVLR